LAFTPKQKPFFFARLKKLKIQKLGPTMCALCQVFKKSKIKEQIQITSNRCRLIYLPDFHKSERKGSPMG